MSNCKGTEVSAIGCLTKHILYYKVLSRKIPEMAGFVCFAKTTWFLQTPEVYHRFTRRGVA
jgi:hypothetical protein